MRFRQFESFDSKKNRKWIYGNSKKVRCEKSGEISRNLRFSCALARFSRSDLNRPKDLARPYKIDPQGKFFRNRSMVFSQRIDLSLGDDGSCTLPLSSGVLLHACKRIYVLFFSSALYFSTKASNSFIYLSSLACPLGRSSPGFLYPQTLMSFSIASSVLYALNDCPEM